MYSWQKRALDPDSPTTKDNETVRTTSSEYRGKEILYPTIRMINGKLKKLSDEEAKQYALVNKDYKEFVSPNQAEAWSKSFSNLIDSNRKDNMAMSQQQALRILNKRVEPLGEEIVSVQKGKNSFEQKLLSVADTSDVKRLPSGRLSYRGETFSGYNQQKRTPGKNKKFAVLAKKGDQVKIVRYGDPNLTIKKDQPKRRKSFRARHGCDAVEKKKDVFAASYWSCKNW